MVNLPPRRSQRMVLNNNINITPFVDVMLVLLIVFMVTAPLLSMGVALDLPRTEAANLSENKEPLVVSIDAQGDLFIQDNPIASDRMIARLRSIAGANADVEIYVRGDQSLAYGIVMAVMGKISAAGFTKVVLLAQSPS